MISASTGIDVAVAVSAAARLAARHRTDLRPRRAGEPARRRVLLDGQVVLKVGAIWVSPAEVEGRLLEHTGVAAVAVVSVPDADGVEKPVACVVSVAGAAVSEDVLVEYLSLIHLS